MQDNILMASKPANNPYPLHAIYRRLGSNAQHTHLPAKLKTQNMP